MTGPSILQGVPMPAVRRLPSYLQILKRDLAEGSLHISSAAIAAELSLEPIQVRKDLQLTGISGQPGVGFDIEDLVEAIEVFLGWKNTCDAFVIGAGNLGTALAGYRGFNDYCLNIAALFDNDPSKVGKTINGREVMHIDRLIDLAWRMHVSMGILTVSAEAAQETADIMVDAGMRAIWNFTHVKLSVPDSVAVEEVDLAASLAVLSKRLAEQLKTDNPRAME